MNWKEGMEYSEAPIRTRQALRKFNQRKNKLQTIMEIQTEIKGSKGSFFYEENGKRLAQSTFSFAGEDKIIVDHTEVDDSLRGKGVGMELIRAAVAFAREKGIRIMPLCPFFKAGFEKHPEFSDVLL